jgi:hypothetical protein
MSKPSKVLELSEKCCYYMYGTFTT